MASWIVPGWNPLQACLSGDAAKPGCWQNLSIRITESGILELSRTFEKVTSLHDATENRQLSSGRTSDLGHLGPWHSECDSTCELVIQPNTVKRRRG
jgi:hypothetical protein